MSLPGLDERTPTPGQIRLPELFGNSVSTNPATNHDFYDSFPDEAPRSVKAAIESSYQGLPSVPHTSCLTPGDANPAQESPSLNMPDSRHPAPSTPDSGRNPGATPRGRSRSHSQSNLARRFPSRPQPPNPHSFSPPTAPAPDAPAFSPYQAPPQYSQAGGYVGQYTVSNPPHMRMVSPPYTYVLNHGYNPQDMPPNTHVGYPPTSMAPPSMGPMMQPHMFPYQSDNNSGAPTHSFSMGSSSIYSHANPSPPPNPVPLSAPPHSAPYSAPATYSQMGFSPPQFSYPSQPYSSASMYPASYAQHSYPQYASEQEGQGAWWYIPPGTSQYENMQPQYHQSHYPMQFPMNSRDMDYTQAGPSTMAPVYSSPTRTQHRPMPQPISSEEQGRSSPQQSLVSSHTGGRKSSELPASVTSGKERASNSGPVRRPYHPNPPTQRSEWVMWAGNVPSDATHDELWRFFSQPPPTATSPDDTGGVSSIFLISRSNCAFVNFDSEEHLQAAILRFSGQQIRPDDAKCPHLVCRVRKKDDDLRAGVGGQRGVGLHVKWVQQYKAKSSMTSSEADGDISPQSSGGSIPSFASMSISSDEEGNTQSQNPSAHSNSSGSYASTNSSMLLQYFPQRYFILKSLTQYDLDLSVEKGVWATQRHNEGILDQAFRTSKDVYLIFGVNKSGEFYGCARMCGQISRTDTKVPWASRLDSPISSRSSQLANRDSPSAQEKGMVLSPGEHRFKDNSPLPVTPQSSDPGSEAPRQRKGTTSAPAELHQPHRKFTPNTPEAQTSLNDATFQPESEDFDLDRSASLNALKQPPRSVSSTLNTIPEPVGEEEHATAKEKEEDDASWGEPFKIEWIHTDRLPFYRTRLLRNPWNHDREIKVSRDGTELEPSVGQALLEEWDRPEPSPSSPTSSRQLGSRPPKNARGKREREGEDG